VAIVVLALGAAALVVVIAWSAVESRLAGWALTSLAGRFGIVAQARELDLDLARLDIHVRGLTLASPVSPDAPFFTVDEARLDLPWSVLRGKIAIDAVELVRPRLTIVVRADGTSNLPAGDRTSATPGSSDDTADPPRLPIGALTVDGLSIEWRDDASGLGLTVGSASLSLAPEGDVIRGAIRLDGAAVFVWEARTVTIASLDGGLTFDGSGLGLDQLRLVIDQSTVTANGRVDGLFGALHIEVDYEAILELADVAPLLGLDTTGVDGRVVATGDMTGPLAQPEITAALDSRGLRWGALEVDALDGRVRWVEDALAVDTATIRLADGEIVVAGTIALGANARESHVEISWRELDAANVLGGLGVALDAAFVDGTALAGELAATWTDLTPGGLTATGELRTRLAGGSGITRLEAQGGLWHVTVDQPLIPGLHVSAAIDATIAEAGLSASSLRGTATVTCSNLTRCLAGLRRDSVDVLQLTGAVTAVVEVAGTVEAPRLTGELSAPALSVAGLPPLDVRATVAADRNRATLATLTARSDGVTVTGRAGVVWATGVVDGRLEAALDDLSYIASVMPAPWSPAGQLDATAILTGTLDALSVDVRVDARDVELAGQPFDRVGGTVRLDGSRVETDGIEIERGDAQARVAGHYEMDGDTFAVRLSGDAFQLTPLFPGTDEEISLGGWLAVDLDARGTLAEPSGTLAVDGTALSWAGYQIGAARATAVLEDTTLRARIEAPDLAAAGVVVISFGDDRLFDARVTVEQVDLARAVAGAVPLTGTGSLSLEASGTLGAASATDVAVRVTALRGKLGGVPLVLTETGEVRYREGAIEIDPIEVTIGQATLRVGGRLTPDGAGTLDARLDGPADEVATLLDVVPGAAAWVDRLRVTGDIGLSVAVTGTPETPVVAGQLSLEGGLLGVDDHPPLSEVNLRAVWEAGAIRLDRLRAVWQGAVVSASGAMPEGFLTSQAPGAGLLRLQVEVDGLTPAALAPYVPAGIVAQLDGRMGARLEVEASAPELEAFSATLTFPEAAFTVAGVPFAQRRETRFVLDNGVVRIARFDWGNATDYLTLGGMVTFDDGPIADLTATGEGDLRTLRALLPGVATAGHALLIVNIQGPIAAPELNGTLVLRDAEFRVPEPRLVVSELNGALLFTGGGVTAHELRGQINGGPLEISGSLALDGLRPTGELRFVGRRIALEVPVGLRTEVDADLGLRLADGQLTLAGTMTVQRGTYREPMSLTGGLLAVLRQQQAVRTIGLDEAGALDAVRLDLRVLTGNDIRLDNNYLDADLGVDVRVGGTIGEPSLTGRLALREGGRVRFGTRTYELERGVVDLVDPTGIEPRLDVTARTRASSYDITLAISGGPEDLTTALTADPPLSESDIVSVLLTGRTLSEATADRGEGAREQALGLVSSELLGSAGRNIGLDVRVAQEGDTGGAIRFDDTLIAADLNPGSRLTAGRRINDQVQVILSQNLRESGLSSIVDYRPLRNIEIRALFDDENDRAYEFRHAIEFGAPATSRSLRTLADRAERPDTRVTDVRFVGDLGYPVDTLHDVVRVVPGDRFDFYRWQRDQDRLASFYVQRGYREVQVRSRRIDGPASAAVALEHEIIRGPPTRLVVQGYDLPRSVRQAMDLAWDRAVFDGFLVDELGVLVREHLSAKGYLRSDVDVSISTRPPVPDNAAKTITIRIVTGPRTERRELVFAGNTVFSAVALDAVLDERALLDVAWANPKQVTDALQSVYRATGYLEATVTAEAPVFDGATARLSIRITEGPRFAVAEVRIDGVSARSDAQARLALGLAPGDPYLERNVRDARGRLELDYRRAGFTAARVTLRSTVDLASARVEIDVAVEEGRQQILEGIVVDGLDRTHPPLVADKLQLDIGAPVDLAAWGLARTRLYDTGMFRSVDLEAQPIGEAPDGATEPVRARVLLEEWPAYSLRYGLRVSDVEAPSDIAATREYRLGFAGDVSRRHLFGRAATTGLSASGSPDRGSARGYLRLQGFFGLPVTSNLFLSRTRETLGEESTAFIKDLTTFTAEQRFRPRPALTIAYSANVDRNHTFDKQPDPDFPFDLTLNILRLDGSAIFDRRDNLFNATRGMFHASTVEYGFEPGEGVIAFAKYFAQHYHYWQAGPFVLATAGRLGLAKGLGNSEVIPSERFFAGGGNTVRGYARDSLGPRNFFDDPAGGNALLILNQEARFPIYRWVSGVGFIDAGNVFTSVGEVSLAGLAVGAGFGLRLDSPVGLLRFDYGFALTRDHVFPDRTVGDTDSKPIGRFFFSIGQAF